MGVFHDWQMKNEKLRMMNKLRLMSLNYRTKYHIYHISAINLQSCQKNTHRQAMFGILWNLWEKPMGKLIIQKTISKWFITIFVLQSFILVSRVLYLSYFPHTHSTTYSKSLLSLLLFNLQKKFPNHFPKRTTV